MKYYYLVEFQYLGYRYHGWQKQSEYKSIQGAIEDSLTKIWGDLEFQILGASRTDSMVSALQSYFELITVKPIDIKLILIQLNLVLDPDIKIVEIKEVDRDFKIIQSGKWKEYKYFFSYGNKIHPFCAPFMTHINEDLDLELMMSAAKIFEGVHYFKNYCYRSREKQNFEREILLSEITINNELTANFFPEKSFIYKVQAKSFMRHQVRLMMGSLFRVGMKQLSLEDLKNTLLPGTEMRALIAPASGLILSKLSFD